MTESEKIRKLSGLSRAAFSRKYQIPIRTLEDWDAGKSTPPMYVLALLEKVVRYDMQAKENLEATLAEIVKN